MRLALIQLNPTVGDLRGNAKKMACFVEQARDSGADLIVFPELVLSGYPPKDLLLREGFVAACAREAKRLGESCSAGLTLIFGCPLPLGDEDDGARTEGGESVSDGAIANSLLVYRDGKPVDFYDKRLLPTYDVFDENRYFTPGERAVVIEVPCRSGGRSARIGLAICEDLWKGHDAGFAARYRHAPDPVAEIARLGADILVVPSASPFVLGKGEKHRKLIRRHAGLHRMYVAAVNQVGGNDDLVFDGHAVVVAPDGAILDAAPGFTEHMLVTDIPFGATGSALPMPMRPREDPLLTADDEFLLFHALTMGLRDYLHKTGHGKAIVGLSGGIDSAVTIALATAALGAANVVGVSMPSRYTSLESREDAADTASRLRIPLWTIPIADVHAAIADAIDPAFAAVGLQPLAEQLPDLTDENIQSRIRGLILMAVSNRSGAMVITTGNKSELAVGYCTLYGDMNGGLAVLSDVTKTQVYDLARWMNREFTLCGFSSPPIPERSITKAPSAELRPNQTDQDSLPPYEVLDAVISSVVESHASPARIAEDTGIDSEAVRRIVSMVDRAEFKRRQLATGLKVTSVAFGSGRRYPIAHGWVDPQAEP